MRQTIRRPRAGAAILPLVLGLVFVPGLTLLPPLGAAPRVRLTMFIWAGANQGVVPREVVARYLRGFGRRARASRTERTSASEIPCTSLSPRRIPYRRPPGASTTSTV